jgi:hypothetical protein
MSAKAKVEVTKKERDNASKRVKTVEEIKQLIADKRKGAIKTRCIITSPEELQLMIDDYFDTLPDHEVRIGKGDKVYTIKPYTITGLVLHCGFCDPVTFYEYERKSEYTSVIKTARARIISHYEHLLQMGANVAGAIFALKNLASWKDTSETNINQTIREIKITVNNNNAEKKLDAV